jgi:hypothetical protein
MIHGQQHIKHLWNVSDWFDAAKAEIDMDIWPWKLQN